VHLLLLLPLVPFYSPLSGSTQVSWYQKKHSPTHTCPDHPSTFICFLHLLWIIASSLFNLRAWQSFCATSVQVLFGLGLAPSTSCTIHFFTLSYFHSTCPYQSNLFCCSTEILSSNPSLSLHFVLGSLSFNLTPVSLRYWNAGRRTIARSPVLDEERMRLCHCSGLVLCVLLSVSTLLVDWQEGSEWLKLVIWTILTALTLMLYTGWMERHLAFYGISL